MRVSFSLLASAALVLALAPDASAFPRPAGEPGTQPLARPKRSLSQPVLPNNSQTHPVEHNQSRGTVGGKGSQEEQGQGQGVSDLRLVGMCSARACWLTNGPPILRSTRSSAKKPTKQQQFASLARVSKDKSLGVKQLSLRSKSSSLLKAASARKSRAAAQSASLASVASKAAASARAVDSSAAAASKSAQAVAAAQASLKAAQASLSSLASRQAASVAAAAASIAAGLGAAAQAQASSLSASSRSASSFIAAARSAIDAQLSWVGAQAAAASAARASLSSVSVQLASQQASVSQATASLAAQVASATSSFGSVQSSLDSVASALAASTSAFGVSASSLSDAQAALSTAQCSFLWRKNCLAACPANYIAYKPSGSNFNLCCFGTAVGTACTGSDVSQLTSCGVGSLLSSTGCLAPNQCTTVASSDGQCCCASPLASDCMGPLESDALACVAPALLSYKTLFGSLQTGSCVASAPSGFDYFSQLTFGTGRGDFYAPAADCVVHGATMVAVVIQRRWGARQRGLRLLARDLAGRARSTTSSRTGPARIRAGARGPSSMATRASAAGIFMHLRASGWTRRVSRQRARTASHSYSTTSEPRRERAPPRPPARAPPSSLSTTSVFPPARAPTRPSMGPSAAPWARPSAPRLSSRPSAAWDSLLRPTTPASTRPSPQTTATMRRTVSAVRTLPLRAALARERLSRSPASPGRSSRRRRAPPRAPARRLARARTESTSAATVSYRARLLVRVQLSTTSAARSARRLAPCPSRLPPSVAAPSAASTTS